MILFYSCHAHFAKSGRTKVWAINDDEALEAAFELTRLEGIIPAIESAHALALLKKEKENFKRVERVRGSFYRRFSLPDTADADKISARSTNGVLEVRIPKQEKIQPRRIQVEG